MADFLRLFPEIFSRLFRGAIVTFEITLLAAAVATLLGLILAFMQRSEYGILRIFSKIYIEIVRGIPALAILYIIYFGLPSMGIRLDSMTSAVVGLGLNGGAYLAVVFRSTIESVQAGQIEASMAAGMNSRDTMRYIILPQAGVIAIPIIGNYVIGLFKDTAIVSTIAAPEIMLAATNVISLTFIAMPTYMLAALMYLCMSYPMSLIVRALEKRLGKGIR